ncbi:MAG: Gldg family protein, partial [Chloroflexota bacterium]
RQILAEQYGLQPIAVSIFSPDTYYLHMVLQIGDEAQLLFPSGDLSEADVRTTIESALKRASSGFLKVVGMWIPPNQPTQNAFGQQQPSLKQYNRVIEQLRQEYTVQPVDLSTGQVPPNVDVLVVIAPQMMSDVERYGIDQFLMRGGAVIASAGNYNLSIDEATGSLAVEPIENGLREMLESYGVTVEQSLVLDPQNEPFPQPVTRDLGNGLQVQEVQALNYPMFVDIRTDGMDQESPILASLPAITVNWASPITVDDAKNSGRQVSTLLRSSPGSWLRTDLNIQPDPALYPELGFPVEGTPTSYPLAVSVQGVFESAFKGQPSPLEAAAQTQDATQPAAVPTNNIGTIENSPDTARLVVISSAEFLNDIVFDISTSLDPNRYLNTLQFIQNTVDWSVEDLDLLTIRSRGTASRVLVDLTEQQRSFWEGANYVAALLVLIGIGFLWRAQQKSEEPMELLPPEEVGY